MKEQNKAMARDLNETDISYMLDRKFKVMMTKILDLRRQWKVSMRHLT